MIPERWRRVKDVLTRVLALPESERRAAIDAECADDADLRAEVLSLMSRVGDDADVETNSHDELRRAVLVQAAEIKPAQQRDDAELLQSTLQANLHDSYELLSTLGTGGMGTVYLARERTLDRLVAIKTLRREHAVTAQSRERFRREARIAAQLSHPGILPLHAFGEVSGVWYLVMGYVRGETLAQRIHSAGRMHADEVRRVIRAVADALEHAHRRQVIHRDIKPANILIDAESGRALLADFGISKATGHSETLTHSGDLLGTPHYMAPEHIVNSQQCDVRSDIYSLGAVAYAMLTGHAPFSSLSAGEVLARRATLRVPPLQNVEESVPQDLASAVMRCLETDPARRFQSAQQLCDTLDRADHSSHSQLSPAMRAVAGFGAYATAWFVLWIAMAFALVAPGQRWPFFLLALVVPFGLALQFSRTRQASTSWRQLGRVAFWPPLWWGMWWPRALRRPDDVWTRLPFAARAVRVVLSLSILALPVLVVGGRPLGLIDDSGSATVAWSLAFGALALASVASVIGAMLATRSLELEQGDALQLLVGPTASSSFWKEPHVARVLSTDTLGVRPPSVDVPSDYVRAMEDLHRRHAAESGDAANLHIVMARRIVNTIASLNREAAALERDSSPQETARVASRLAVLRNSAPGAGEEHQALVQIVQSELQLLQRMAQRREMALSESAALFNVLRTMWREVERLPDQQSEMESQRDRLSELMEQGAALLSRQAPVTPA